MHGHAEAKSLVEIWMIDDERMVTAMIQVQHLRVRWTKEHRGAAAGTIRNRLPKFLPFAPPESGGAGWLQLATFDAADDYHPAMTWQAFPLVRERDGLSIEASPAFARVSVWPIGNLLLQKPNRPNFHGLIAQIPVGCRITLRVNSALDYQAQRSYVDHIMHIGYGAAPLFDLALQRTIDERVTLY